MAVISSPVYDPPTYADKLAKAYVAGSMAINDARISKAADTSSALDALGSALSSFQAALAAMNDGTKSVSANSATFSTSAGTAVATATANSDAVAGTYAFYVEQLATAGQVSYNVADSAASGAGSMNVTLADGNNFQVNLTNADSNGDGTLTAKEIATAINVAAGNNSRVKASTLMINGQAKMVLTSVKTGAGNAVASIDVSALGSPALQANLSAQTTMTTAKDAIVWVGGQGGTKVQQASNEFTVVDNVKFTITAAQAPAAAPVTLTVGADNSATATNVQAFVTAYNNLMALIDKVSAAGDHTVVEPTTPDGAPKPASGDAPFHNDAGLKSLRDRIASTLRSATGGVSLISFGISSDKKGVLTVDSGRLNKALSTYPGKLDTLFGRAGVGVDSGVLGTMNKLVKAWTSGSSGFIAARRTQNDRLASDAKDRDDAIKAQYNNAYKRYLGQFTQLQSVQAAMTNTSNMFTAMFSSDSNN